MKRSSMLTIVALAASTMFDVTGRRVPSAPDFNTQRKIDTRKGGERAQFKAERERSKFPRKRK